jgi:XTP/dITP diphosphohydrolase
MSAGSTIVLATGNPGKIAELRALIAPLALEVVAQTDLDVPEAEETGLTFVENAILKARNAARHTGLPAIADDSGLEVDALEGRPGVRSARYAGAGAADRDHVDKLLAELGGRPAADRGARFRCLMVYLRHADDPAPLIAEGVWDGAIADRPRGGGGFGYDPVFVPAGFDRTAAELDPAHKNRFSHRGQALRFLVERLAARTPTALHP